MPEIETIVKQESNKTPPAISGLVVIDKPAGMTSHDVVSVARKLFRTKRVGHTGTLDPDATGVLVLCLGNATRLAEYLSAARKHYVADVVFGIETDTQDASGQVLAERDAAHLTEDEVRRVLPAFRGAIQQVPPMVSALHHEGQRLYDLARQGIVVERAARAVQIDELELTAWTPGVHPTARLEITCSTGTYIRSLAADIGAAAGVGGMMQTLRRTWIGERDGETSAIERPFALEAAHTLDELRERAQVGTLAEVVLSLDVALAGWPQIRLTAEQTTHVRHGRPLVFADISPAQRVNWDETAMQENEQTLLALLDADGEVIAVAHVRGGYVKPHKVFAPAA